MDKPNKAVNRHQPIASFNGVQLTSGNFAYYVGRVPNGDSMGLPGHYFPGIAVRGESGYYVTDWDWGTDGELARQCADDLNREIGLTPQQANEIICSSMFAKKGGRRG